MAGDGKQDYVDSYEDVSMFALASDAAAQWLTLLRALEQPASSLRLRAVAIGAFFGWDATRLASAGDGDWEHLDDRVHEWVEVVRTHGAAGLLARLDTQHRLGRSLRERRSQR